MLQVHDTLCLSNLEQHMIPIEGGTFEMGGESRFRKAKPIHKVFLDDYELCRYPVSQQLWREVMRADPEELFFQHQTRPVERVSKDDIVNEFLPRLHEISGDSSYCLPTEAQWEYAARGGKYHTQSKAQISRNPIYSGSDIVDEVGWYDKNSYRSTYPAAMKRPNLLGLYDMSGNVFEWTQDYMSEDYYQQLKDQYGEGAAPNPKGPSRKSSLVVRGGSWDLNYFSARVSDRVFDSPYLRLLYIGFRLCRYRPR